MSPNTGLGGEGFAPAAVNASARRVMSRHAMAADFCRRHGLTMPSMHTDPAQFAMCLIEIVARCIEIVQQVEPSTEMG